MPQQPKKKNLTMFYLDQNGEILCGEILSETETHLQIRVSDGKPVYKNGKILQRCVDFKVPRKYIVD